MKKSILLLLSLALIVGESYAQQARRLSRAEIVANMQQYAPDLYRSHQAGSALAGVGLGLIIGGGAATILGIATADTQETTSNGTTTINFTGTGGAIAAAGAICAIAGIPILIIGNSKKRNARNAYVKQYGSTAYEPVMTNYAPHMEVRPGALAFVF